MFKFRSPRWPYAPIGIALALIFVVVAPAVRATAEGDSSPTPVASAEAPKASATTKAEPSEEAPSPDPMPTKASEKAAPAPAKTTEAPAPKVTTVSPTPVVSKTGPAKVATSSPSPSATAKPLLTVLNPEDARKDIPTVCSDGKLLYDLDRIADTKPHGDRGRVVFEAYGSPDRVEGHPTPADQYTYDPTGQTWEVHDFGVGPGTPCGEPKTKVTAVDGTFLDPCGPEFNLEFTPAKTDGVEYVKTRTGNTIQVTPKVTDPAKYELTNPGWSQTATDELVACPVVAPKAKLVVACERDDEGKLTGWAEAGLRLDNTQVKIGSQFLVKTIWPGDSVDSDLFVAAETKEIFYGYFPAGGVLRNVVTWEGKVLLDQSDNTQECVLKDEPKPGPDKPSKPKPEPTKPHGWQKDKGHDRGISPNTGPGEEPLELASPFFGQAGTIGIVLVLCGVVVFAFFRRKEA